MRFKVDGPDIPDELLIARDAGRVIFFCGAGVSQHEAELPNFATLAHKAIESLGAAQDSRARVLFDLALKLKPVPGLGSLVATDRVFGLLEQEFEVSDVRAAVAKAILPKPDVKLGAHRVLLNLATARGVTRLVTTNFDLLFEACDSALPSYGPPSLPDPHSDREFRGIVHLHGRVGAAYRCAQDEEFVISSADFGRAYLSVGWATRFIQQLLSHFQVVFVGYTADDPPMQYLLEGLNLRAGTRNRLYAFQSGEQNSAIALWEHRGVKAIPFDNSNGFTPLWSTLQAWSERARDAKTWFEELLTRATAGPRHLAPQERGQIAHILSTSEGARRLALAPEPVAAEWLLVADPTQRYATPFFAHTSVEDNPPFDPFDALCLDSDPTPEPIDPEDVLRGRQIPEEAVDLLRVNILDLEQGTRRTSETVRGSPNKFNAELSPRLVNIGLWLRRVAHQPVALWWAAHQQGLHPHIIHGIENALLHESPRFGQTVHRGWRMLISAWADQRIDPDERTYEIEQRAHQEGWSLSLIRELFDVFRPRLTVKPSFGIPHPLVWTDEGQPDQVVRVDVEYPRSHESVQLPDEWISYAVDCYRNNLDLTVALEREVSGTESVYLQTSRGPDDGPELPDDIYGLTGSIIYFQKLMKRFASIDLKAARNQICSWPSRDEYVFARLRIWAAGAGLLSSSDTAAIFFSLTDRVFWGSVHERDFLYALRDRWVDLSPNDRNALEQRLLTGSFPWDAEVLGEREEAIAHDRMSRLHWLSVQGVPFSFDVKETIRTLRAVAPKWTEHVGEAVADSNAPQVFSIAMDNRPDPLLATPIPEILHRARELGSLDIRGRTEFAPFRGLAVKRPTLALGALTHAARSGDAPLWAWAAFLRADTRPADSLRMVRTVAARLRRLPQTSLRGIAYPVSEWMKAISDRLYSDATNVLPDLWDAIVNALRATEVEPRRHSSKSWATDALNAPVGKLFDVLMKDPAKDGLSTNDGFPRHWTARLDDLLGLPGDMRRHALVLLGFQLNWLFTIDPMWTKHRLLRCACDSGYDSDALWDGILWCAKAPPRSLFVELKPAILARARESHRRERTTILAGFLLHRWGNDAETDEPLLTDLELREILIHADDEFRQQLLWQFGRWSEEYGSSWRKRVIPFFQRVWPKQRALHTPGMSSHLVNFALASGCLMPALVELILPGLVPIRNAHLRFTSHGRAPENDPARVYPAATLDLLWAILGEDAATWPYRIEQKLDLLSQASETSADARLAELRRRMELS